MMTLFFLPLLLLRRLFLNITALYNRAGLCGTSWSQTFEQWISQGLWCLKLVKEPDFVAGVLPLTCFRPVNYAFHVCSAETKHSQSMKGKHGVQVLSLTRLLVRISNTTYTCLVNVCLQRNVERKKRTEKRTLTWISYHCKKNNNNMSYEWFEWMVLVK